MATITHRLALVALIVLFSLGQGFSIEEQNGADGCANPFLYEYIQDYQMDIKDLQTLIENNLTSLSISDITGSDKTVFTNIKVPLNYIGTGRSVSRLNALEYDIANDTFGMVMSWKA